MERSTLSLMTFLHSCPQHCSSPTSHLTLSQQFIILHVQFQYNHSISPNFVSMLFSLGSPVVNFSSYMLTVHPPPSLPPSSNLHSSLTCFVLQYNVFVAMCVCNTVCTNTKYLLCTCIRSVFNKDCDINQNVFRGD